ncbi:MAG: hypothetical protein HXY34_12930 [Candidatus Thorarchaeota archaeon]|nr:hypothetical protein [Candidatus Thorarchaeota archaeon]
MAKYSGSGQSFDDPIQMTEVTNNMEAVSAEYAYLRQRYGTRNVDWKLVCQYLLQHEGRTYDRLDIELKGGDKLSIYFDITPYFGVY